MSRRFFAAAALVAVGAMQPDAVRLQGPATQGGLLRGTVAPEVVALVLRAPGAADVPVALSDGRFIVGFDRDAGPVATLVARDADGDERAVPLAVASRDWPRRRIDLDPEVGLGAAFAQRRPAELARIAAARARSDDALGGWTEPMRWPAAGRFSAGFGAGRVYRGGFESVHAGTDIAAPTGTPVVAPASGRVVLAAAAPFTLEGNLLMIDHGGGLSSAFLHLSRIDVVEGELVAAGQPLGAIGATGRATGPHLHWALRWRDARVDAGTAVRSIANAPRLLHSSDTSPLNRAENRQ